MSKWMLTRKSIGLKCKSHTEPVPYGYIMKASHWLTDWAVDYNARWLCFCFSFTNSTILLSSLVSVTITLFLCCIWLLFCPVYCLIFFLLVFIRRWSLSWAIPSTLLPVANFSPCVHAQLMPPVLRFCCRCLCCCCCLFLNFSKAIRNIFDCVWLEHATIESVFFFYLFHWPCATLLSGRRIFCFASTIGTLNKFLNEKLCAAQRKFGATFAFISIIVANFFFFSFGFTATSNWLMQVKIVVSKLHAECWMMNVKYHMANLYQQLIA